MDNTADLMNSEVYRRAFNSAVQPPLAMISIPTRTIRHCTITGGVEYVIDKNLVIQHLRKQVGGVSHILLARHINGPVPDRMYMSIQV